MKVYIAGPFFNEKQVETICAIESLLHYRNVKYFSPRSFGIIKDMTPEEKKARMREVYLKNISEIHASDYLIAFVDGYDAGTMFEIGYAICLGKKVVTFTVENRKVNVMLKESVSGHAVGILKLDEFVRLISEELGFENLSDKFSEEVE